MRYVGVGRRAVAQVIDILFSMLWWIPSAKIDHLSGGGYQLTWTVARAVMSLCISALYFVLLEKLLGATVGKFIVGVRVRSIHGSSIGWGASVIRNALRVVDGIPYAPAYLVGAIAIWAGGPSDQRLGDRAAGTVVVRGGTQGLIVDVPAMPALAEMTADGAPPPLPEPPDPGGITSDLPWN